MFFTKTIHLSKENSKKNKIALLFDEATSSPCLYPLLFSIAALSDKSLATQQSDMLALKYWYEFWYQKYSTTFCESFYSTSYNFEIIQSEIDNFIIYLENNKKIESNLTG